MVVARCAARLPPFGVAADSTSCTPPRRHRQDLHTRRSGGQEEAGGRTRRGSQQDTWTYTPCVDNIRCHTHTRVVTSIRIFKTLRFSRLFHALPMHFRRRNPISRTMWLAVGSFIHVAGSFVACCSLEVECQASEKAPRGKRPSLPIPVHSPGAEQCRFVPCCHDMSSSSGSQAPADRLRQSIEAIHSSGCIEPLTAPPAGAAPLRSHPIKSPPSERSRRSDRALEEAGLAPKRATQPQQATHENALSRQARTRQPPSWSKRQHPPPATQCSGE